MALKKCQECDNMVSNQAKTCPHCGARVKKSRWGIVILFALLVVACVIILTIMDTQVDELIRKAEKAEIEMNSKTILEDDKKVLEGMMRSWLNERAQEIGLDRECSTVSLVRESTNKYVGFAELDNGDKIEVEATTDGDGVLGHDVLFRAEPFISLK